MLCAIPVEKTTTFDTETGLQAVDRIVDARMNHFTVATARLLSRRRILFQKQDREGSRLSRCQMLGNGETHDTSTDYAQIKMVQDILTCGKS